MTVGAPSAAGPPLGHLLPTRRLLSGAQRDWSFRKKWPTSLPPTSSSPTGAGWAGLPCPGLASHPKSPRIPISALAFPLRCCSGPRVQCLLQPPRCPAALPSHQPGTHKPWARWQVGLAATQGLRVCWPPEQGEGRHSPNPGLQREPLIPPPVLTH